MDDDRTVEQGAALHTHVSQLRKTAGPRYRRISSLGAGGMGEVWLERDERIGRDIAIKTLHAPDAAPEVATRFLREACVQGQLEHPSIVPVYDLGWNDAGEPYLAMKRVRGQTLLSILAGLARKDPETSSRFGQRRLLAAMSQVCLAVHFAHERGVIHRDIKPANIMLGDHGEVYVLDWGVAKLAGVPDAGGAALAIDPSDDTPATMEGAMMGTLSYMSPEQARGDAFAVGARSDVYSLGAVLFEVLTLNRFVDAPSAEARRISIVDGIDARISVRFPFLAIAPELEDLCVRATRVDLTERIASARDLSERIERFLDGVRDHEVRERRVEMHLGRVRASLDAALAGDAALRADVAREAGAALALSPDNLEARRAVLTLMTQPPPQIPEAVLRSMDKARAPNMRRYYIGTLVIAAIYAPAALLFLTAREHGAVLVLSSWAAQGVAALIAWRALRRPGDDGLRVFLIHCATMSGIVPMTVYSPALLVAPVITGVSLNLVARHVGMRWLSWAVVLGIAPVVIATVLAFAGLAGNIGHFEGGELHIWANIDERWGQSMVPAAWLMSILPLITSAVLAVSSRREADDAERAIHLSRWQFAQLVPAEIDAERNEA